jgi:PAS domain S-box-containing protein
MTTSEADALRQEVSRLRHELQDAEETIRAIRDGRVDAFVVGGSVPERVYTLETAVGPYRILVERMQQCAVTIAADSTILYANRQTSSLLDRSPGQLVGTFFRELVAEDDLAQFEAIVNGDVDVASAPAPEGEIRLKRADGTLVPVYLSAGGMSPECGGGCFLITDLTRQKQHEELIAAENLARSMLQQAADAVVVCDPDGQVAFASPAAHELCGRNPLGHPFSELFPLAFAGEASFSRNGRLELDKLDEPVRGVEASLSHGDTANRSLLLSAGPVRGSNGESLGFVVTLADIGPLKRAQQELREADRRKDEFLAVLAHELRNPLAPIVTGLDVIELAGGSGETSARALQMIKRQVEHLNRLVDDLLEVSRITLGKIELQKEVLIFADVLADALETTRYFIETSNHSVKIDLPAEPIKLEADGVRLSQVMVNLLNNAAKYTPPDGDILISARVQDDQLEIRVRDSGRGIEADALDEVFTMFAQSRRSNRLHDGLGVGLALVRRIVELHGGSVGAASGGIGQGSEFTVRLPIGDTTAVSTTGESIPKEEQAFRKRVLVVDDNEDSANSLGMLLDMMDYEVKVAFDGESALAELNNFPAEAIFLDLDMPRMDGYEVARRVRQRTDAHDATLIALTGWGQEDDRMLTRDAGFDHHLLKPVNVEELRSLLIDSR